MKDKGSVRKLDKSVFYCAITLYFRPYGVGPMWELILK